MTIDLDPKAFRAAYSRFLDAPEAKGRILLTGHSHQAWPDVARDAVTRSFDDAARLVDDKWGAVFGVMDSVGRRGPAGTPRQERDSRVPRLGPRRCCSSTGAEPRAHFE